MNSKNISRRGFLKTSAAVSASAILAGSPRAFAAGSDTMRIGLVGCGDRGTQAVTQCIKSSKGVELVAMADVFKDKLNNSLKVIKKECPDNVKVTRESSFIGFDAYKELISYDLDIVLLTTPPGFRPIQFKAAVEGNRHVFMEKPGGVDPVGIRTLIAASELADKKGLSVMVGTQQRRQYQYLDIFKRIKDGQIGEIVSGQCYWNWGFQDWHFNKRQPHWSDMEWQLRCWPYFTWLSGDHIVEQHLHNIDIVNWIIGSHPIKCLGVGGRQVRTSPEYGNIFDHFSVEYEYPNDIRVLSMCSQINGTTGRVLERIVGSKGSSNTTRQYGNIEVKGKKVYEYNGPMIDGQVKGHADLIESIRSGKPFNEGKQLAESTLTAIMGRMSAYTGRAVQWSWLMNASKEDLSPKEYKLGPLPVREVPIPGKTNLI